MGIQHLNLGIIDLQFGHESVKDGDIHLEAQSFALVVAKLVTEADVGALEIGIFVVVEIVIIRKER